MLMYAHGHVGSSTLSLYVSQSFPPALQKSSEEAGRGAAAIFNTGFSMLNVKGTHWELAFLISMSRPFSKQRQLKY